jgi:hypothetical protein
VWDVFSAFHGHLYLELDSHPNSTRSGWALFTRSFSLMSAGTQNLIFEATGLANQLGGFIDTVSVVKDRDLPGNEVPKPASLALVGAALIATVWLGRR